MHSDLSGWDSIIEQRLEALKGMLLGLRGPSKFKSKEGQHGSSFSPSPKTVLLNVGSTHFGILVYGLSDHLPGL